MSGQTNIFLDLLNAERQNLGLSTFTVNPILQDIAEDQARNMKYTGKVQFKLGS